MSEDFQHLLRAEMERVEAAPRASLVREAHRNQQRRRKLRQRAGIAATGCVAVVAAAATVVALQPGAPRPGSSAGTGSSAQAAAPVKVNLGGVGAAVQTTSAPVSATLTAKTDTTAASVLDQAAQASGSGNVPLVNGWPAAPYWHTLSQSTNSDCPGQVVTSNNWLGKDGTDVAGNEVTTGPTSSDPTSSCDVSPKGYYPVNGTPAGAFIGGQQYSWEQFAALPTDPAKLWPILEADSNVGVAPGKGGLYWTYSTVVLTLENDPVAPEMRVALYKVMEKFPGVKVTGTYTDSLGRTGTAISLTAPSYGSTTVVIDSSTGQVLAQLGAAEPVPPGCVRATVGGSPGATCVVSGASTEVFITAGPADTTPLHIAKFTMPNVVGDTLAKAQRVLTQLGIESGSLKGAEATTPGQLPTGTVIAQSPAAGTPVTQEEVPTLTIRP